MQVLIRRIWTDTGTTVLMVTHDPSDAMAIATDIAGNSGVTVNAPADDTAAAEASSHPTTSAVDAAEATIGAIESGAYRLVIGKDAKFVDWASRVAPQWAANYITKKMGDLLERA